MVSLNLNFVPPCVGAAVVAVVCEVLDFTSIAQFDILSIGISFSLTIISRFSSFTGMWLLILALTCFIIEF